jgi:hypothetical protein
MNERIRELKEQAWEYAMAVHDGLIVPPPDKEVWPVDKVFDEKFAELIVRECIDKITTYDLVPGHSAKWEDIYDIHARLLQDLGEELKEHFGVTK